MCKSTLNLINYNLSIFKKESLIYLYIHNNNYFILIKITERIKIKIKSKNVLEISKNNITNNSLLQTFIKQFYLCEFSKIKFTGKGYKIKKNSKNSLILLFNRAHTTTIFWQNMFIKKLKKYKMYIKFTTPNKNVINTIIGVRPINVFTKKGLRQSRQVLLKKKGKK